MELIVVMAVVVLLTSLLLPTFSQVRENLHRVVCSSNMRQLGIGIHMYARNNEEKLPLSRELEAGMPLELMAAHIDVQSNGWDGLGLLFSQQYCSAAECFYCPSHTGSHTIDRYNWLAPRGQIYTNYHYSGHADWLTNQARRLDEDDLILATDGFRQESDFNHETGMNILHGDGAVRWFEDSDQGLVTMLAQTRDKAADPDFIWRELERLGRRFGQ